MKAIWSRFVATIPLGLALTCIALVAAGGWVWSFEEQTARAEELGFALPWLLPLVLDGLSLSLAGVAFAAALDGRPAVFARISTALAVLTSAASNAEAAWARSDGKPTTVAIASIVPIAANLAFEVFLGELRRQVHRGRGLAAPTAVAGPRLIRLALSPIRTGKEWRNYVLAATALPPTDPIVEASTAPVGSPPQNQSAHPGPTVNPAPAERPRPSAGSDTNPTGLPDPVGQKFDPTEVNPPDSGRVDPKPSRGRTTDPIRSVPDWWVKPTGSDDHLTQAVWSAIKRGWVTVPLAEADVLAVVRAGGTKARALRDVINKEAKEQATDGDKEAEVVS